MCREWGAADPDTLHVMDRPLSRDTRLQAVFDLACKLATRFLLRGRNGSYLGARGMLALHNEGFPLGWEAPVRIAKALQIRLASSPLCESTPYRFDKPVAPGAQKPLHLAWHLLFHVYALIRELQRLNRHLVLVRGKRWPRPLAGKCPLKAPSQHFF